MKRVTCLISAAAAWLVCLTALPAYAIEDGAIAPAFDVGGQSNPVKLADYRGKLVYLDFWASWCGPCKRSFPWMRDLQSRFGSQGLQVVAVNLDEKHGDALDFLAALSVNSPVNFPIGFDAPGAVAHAYGLKGMPTSVLIGADGKVIATHRGFNAADEAALEKLIADQLRHMHQ